MQDSQERQYYDNRGFHPEYVDPYRYPADRNVYVQYPRQQSYRDQPGYPTPQAYPSQPIYPPPSAYPSPHAYPSSVPHYIPQVSSDAAVPVADDSKPGKCCKPKTRRITCITATVIILVAAAVILAVLIWYFVTKYCLFNGMSCGSSGACVRKTEWCDGTPQCPGGEDENQCVRLSGPQFVLQAYSSQYAEWRSVCVDDWNDTYGRTACRDIGYSVSTYYTSGPTATDGSSDFMRLNTSSGSAEIYRKLYNSNSCPSKRVVSLRCINCGTSTKAASTRIVGGTPAARGEWPWQVSLQIRGTHVCGGSIITPDWIVTAAHCVEGSLSAPAQWRVYAGYLYLYEMTSSYLVEKIIFRSDYETKTKNNDIALMKLASPITFSERVKPVCLPNSEMNWEAPRQCWISGWGATAEGGQSSVNLRAAPVNLIDPLMCNQRAVYNGAITDSMICAGYLAGQIDSCQGDSGGPLVTSMNSLWWLVGDTSWGTGCAYRNRPGVYGNVTMFVDWIYRQMQANR